MSDMNQALKASQDYQAERKVMAEQAMKGGDYFFAYANKNADLHGLMHQCKQLLAQIDKCESMELVGGDEIMFDIELRLLRETVEQYWEEYDG